jgi:acylphosphatase
MIMKRLHIIVSGRVQGVNFRYYTKQRAKELDLKGWAKNTGFKKVEMIVEGNEEDLDKFVSWCKEGPYYAEVEDIEVKEEPYQKEFSDFEVRY